MESTEVRGVGPEARGEWDRFVRSRPDATGYQLWAWTDILETVTRLSVFRLAAFRDGEMVGVLPVARQRMWPLSATLVSLPFVNYAGLVAIDATAEERLLDAVVALAGERGMGRIELRHDAVKAGQWACREDKVRFIYDLSGGEETMWSALPGQRRTQVRKAQKSGLVGHVGGRELFGEFHALVARKWRDLGSPVLPRRLFETVLERFPEDSRICVVRMGDETAAAGFLYRFRNRVENPWVGALDAYAKQQANVMLYWTMMVESANWGADSFDFGRSSRDSGNYTYKSRWNAREVALPWSVWPPTAVEGAESGGAATLVKAVWKQLPLPLANFLGPWLSPNLPL